MSMVSGEGSAPGGTNIPTSSGPRRAPRPWLPWVLGAIIVALVVALVVVLLDRDGEPAPDAAPTSSALTATPPPAATTAPVTPTSASAAPGDAACTVDYEIRDRWADGFTVDVTVRNDGAALDGWTVGWRFAGAEEVGNIWNVVVDAKASNGATVVVRDAQHNAKLASGASASFGFVGAGASAGTPTDFVLDGRPCSPAAR